jgi:hypothetical protein
VDHRREAVLVQQRKIDRLEESLEHQDGLRRAHHPQPRGFLEIEHCEAVGGVEGAGGTLEAVAVRVRLEHRPQLRAAGIGLRDREVVRKRGCRDAGADRTGHFLLLCYKAPRYQKVATHG